MRLTVMDILAKIMKTFTGIVLWTSSEVLWYWQDEKTSAHGGKWSLNLLKHPIQSLQSLVINLSLKCCNWNVAIECDYLKRFQKTQLAAFPYSKPCKYEVNMESLSLDYLSLQIYLPMQNSLTYELKMYNFSWEVSSHVSMYHVGLASFTLGPSWKTILVSL